MKTTNKKAYSVIISLLLIGFLLILSAGIFSLILNELKSSRAMGDYIKAFAGAESSQEIALLDIKRDSFGSTNKIEKGVNDKSVLLSENFLDKSKYNLKNDVLISYFIDGETNSYSGTIDPLEYNILPLFTVDESGTELKVHGITLEVLEGLNSDLVWNILGEDNGISGLGNDLLGSKKTLTSGGFVYEREQISDFLSASNNNYMILYNNSSTDTIRYSIRSTDPDEKFTRPNIEIISTGEVGDYKQNIKTTINLADFFKFLKYSIYSN